MEDQTKDTGNPTTEQAEEAVFGSGSFFEEIENSVNGVIQEEPQPQTETRHNPVDPRNKAVATEPEGESLTVEVDRLKKRYGDSTREAQKLKAELDDLKPFAPVLDAMKKDSGLVEHVKAYLTGEVTPQNIKDQLGLDEDFVFDSDEAFSNPESSSAKLMDHYVQKAVAKKMESVMDAEKQQAYKASREASKAKEEAEFKAKHNMSDEEFSGMVDQAKQHKLTLEDIHYLLNRDKVQGKVANNARGEVLQQMKNVQNMPTSVSGTNSAEADKSPDDKIWEGLMGTDGDLDNLFGE